MTEESASSPGSSLTNRNTEEEIRMDNRSSNTTTNATNSFPKEDEEGDEELLSATPVETAYSPVVRHRRRRRRAFGSTKDAIDEDETSSQNTNASTNEDPAFNQMTTSVEDNTTVEIQDNKSKPIRQAWVLDADEDSQDSVTTKDSTKDDPEEEDNKEKILSPEKSKAAEKNSHESNIDSSDSESTTSEHTSAAQDDKKNAPEENMKKIPEEEDNDDDTIPKTAAKKFAKPTKKNLTLSIDKLFDEADKQTVTVRDIVCALEEEYGITISKATKSFVRSRLLGLIQGDVESTVKDKKNNSNNTENEVSDMEGDEESSSEEEQESSDDEAEDPGSEYEDDEEAQLVQRKARAAAKKSRAAIKKATSKAKKMSGTRRKSLRESAAKSKKASIHAHAEKLRQKRMQELRVRNEELQLQQSAEDRERAEKIAARFETNTEEQKWQRLEDRLDLLQKLDRKRLQIIDAEDIPLMQLKKLEDERIAETAVLAAAKEKDDIQDDDESDSDDGMELEIVGASGDWNKPLFASTAKKPTALAVLDLADMASPMAKKNPQRKKIFLANLAAGRNVNLSEGAPRRPKNLSPHRNKNARAMLRGNLLKKQRKMGNMWLARELGYKNEKEHLRDCMEAEKKKRDMVLLRENQRLAENERTQLRERLREPIFEVEEEEELEQKEDASTAGDEEDEEMAMAKQMEQDREFESVAEKSNTEAPSAVETSVDAGTAEAPVDVAESTKDGKPLLPTAKEATAGPGKAPHNVNDCSTESHKETQFESSRDSRVKLLALDKNMQLGAPEDDAGMQTTDSESALSAQSDQAMTNQGDEDGLDAQNFDKHAFSPASPVITGETVAADAAKEAATSDVSPNNGRTEKKVHSPAAADTDDIVDTDDEQEFDDSQETEDAEKKTEKKERNAAWKAMLEREAKQLKKRKGNNEFLETEADEEEEEEVAGLEDFGFSVHKKKAQDDDEDAIDDEINAEDLKHVVDDVSDDEGDEETGEKMRIALAQKEEKERHKEMLRRMREGYDGRRGGIAGGSSGARGMHRFDELVAADNREDAKNLGLLNDDEMDSDDDGTGTKKDDEEEDEAALLDKMLKDRFLHRSSVELEENFSEDESGDEGNKDDNETKNDEDDQEQEKLAKRFAKRARMERLIEEYGHEEEFSRSRLIEEDATMKDELLRMKVGFVRPVEIK